MSTSGKASLALRVGLAFALLYPPYAAIGDPVSWEAYFPSFVRALPIGTDTLLRLFGAGEVVLALWLLSGFKVRIPAYLTAALMAAIVVFNLPQFDILFRDISLACMALALAFLPAPNGE